MAFAYRLVRGRARVKGLMPVGKVLVMVLVLPVGIRGYSDN